jgi:hypothetical protein
MGLGAQGAGLGDRLGGPGGAGGIELVVDGQADHRAAMGPGPVQGQDQQGQAVAAAGEAHRQGRGGVGAQAAVEGGGEGGKDVIMRFPLPSGHLIPGGSGQR